MTRDQTLIFAILAATMAMFVWGRWRHDMVALGALLACVFAGLLPAESAFAGFGHPAVITVACVLVLSQGLQATGAVDALAQRLLPGDSSPMLAMAALVALGTAMSAFINNVGAMALLMPLAIQIASKHELAPGKVLMPLSFGTILGGMTTLIGTPPNLIVSAFRVETGAGSFGMFDFTPVGIAVAAAGVLFVLLLGWRIVPTREQKGATGFDTGAYLTEVRVPDEGKVVGKSLRELEDKLEKADIQIIGMVRNEFRVTAPNPGRVLRAGDILVIESDPENLASALSSLGLKLEEHVPPEDDDADRPGEPAKTDGAEEKKDRATEEVVLQELVVMPTSTLLGRSASDLRLRTVHGLNLLAISRQGRRSVKRLRSTAMKAGDVLLMQGPPEGLSGFAAEFGCVPLALDRKRVADGGRVDLGAGGISLDNTGAALGLLPAAISFTAGVLAFMAFRILPLRRVYDAIDWPVIVLLGALIPVAGVMATTGAADLLAQGLLTTVAQGRPIFALALILIVTMTLSDFMNNAATAAVMCPIAISTATQLGANADSFLMAVAIGASCAFLTPIGHQNNTLIMGPGGFRFGDYWRLGLPMELLVVSIAVPMLLWVWPL